MTPHERLVKSTRQNQRTVHLIAAMYIVLGLVLAGLSPFTGNVLVGVIGVIIISLAAGAGVILVMMLRLGERMSFMIERTAQVEEELDRVGTRLADLTEEITKGGVQLGEISHDVTCTESSVAELTNGIDSMQETLEHISETLEKKEVEIVNLAEVGKGDPGELSSTILQHSAFPRLVVPVEDGEESADYADEDDSTSLLGRKQVVAAENISAVGTMNSTRTVRSTDLQRRWMIAMHDEDVLACRAVLAELNESVDASLLTAYQDALARLVKDVKKDLRVRFMRCLHAGDIRGALRVGEEIISVLPDHRIAADFERIKPKLEAQLPHKRANSQSRAYTGT